MNDIIVNMKYFAYTLTLLFVSCKQLVVETRDCQQSQKYLNYSAFIDSNSLLEIESSIDSIGLINVLNSDSIPQNVWSFINSYGIRFTNSNVDSLPQKVVNLGCLSELGFYRQKIIPRNIKFIRELKRVVFSECTLEKLPKEFCALTNLEAIIFYETYIEDLSSLMCLNSKSFKILKFDQNGFKKLPEANYYQLEKLLINEPFIDNLPEFIFELENISELIIHVNSLPMHQINILKEIYKDRLVLR